MNIKFYGKRSMMKFVAIAIATVSILATPIATVGQSSPSPTSDLTNVRPQFSLSANDLFNENARNPQATHQKYQRSVIEINGIVEVASRNIIKVPLVGLKVSSATVGVACGMTEKEPWAKVVPGQAVKLKGIWPVESFSSAQQVILENCLFSEIGPSPAINISAEQLAREFENNPEVAGKKYKNKYLIVTGEVIDKEKPGADEYVARAATLQGTDKVKIKSFFAGKIDTDQLDALKLGLTAKVVCAFSDFSLNEVSMFVCNSITQ